jgi:DNA-binding MarR family transcriptional regulator
MKAKKADPWSSTPHTSQRVVSAIARIASILRAGTRQFATAQGLNPTQVDILEMLAARSEGVRLSWIAQQLGVTPASASDSIASLTDKALVEKGRADDDGRAIALSLTPLGEKLVSNIHEATAFAAAAVNALPATTQATLFESLLAMISQLQQAERFPEIRTCITCKHFAVNVHHGAVAPHHCRLVNAALPSSLLRLDCAEHESADPRALQANRHFFEDA